MTTNADQLMRGNSRLAADKSTRSAARNAGLRTWRRSTANWWRRLMISRSFDALDRNRRKSSSRTRLDRDVNNEQNHGSSDNTTRGPLFYADRINAPYKRHEVASQAYETAGLQILELAQTAYSSYVAKNPHEQARLIKTLVSNVRSRKSFSHLR